MLCPSISVNHLLSDFTGYDTTVEPNVFPSTDLENPVSDSVGSSSYSETATDYTDKYSFLTENKTGILSKSGLSRSELTPQQDSLYRSHRNIQSKLCRLQNLLKNERAQLNSLKDLYNQGRFKFIEENLNDFTKSFLNSQLQNVNIPPTGRRWTVKGKAFALSIFKRSPRLYRYLRAFFQLPSPRTLQTLLSHIPFECGVLVPVLEYLKLQTEEMTELERNCALIFDEISLSSGFSYESHKQRISGFEDLGQLGRTSNQANHALVFMIRGIKKNFKIPVAYYFVKDTVKSTDLKNLIILVIEKLQMVGIKICATVCDQGSTNRGALSSLVADCTNKKPSPYHFVVNGQTIFTIFDVPHLLKNTRNALIKCKIEFRQGKFASMEHIKQAFLSDKMSRTYKLLNKLNDNHFNFNDTYMKMKVNVAARQLSHTMAAAIETFHACGELKPDALGTAEFCHIIDNLFDSLNSSQFNNFEGKKFRSALSVNSPHLKFWSEILPQISNWKVLENGIYKNNFKFIEGWQTTIRSVMALWQNLRAEGLLFLNLRNLNQDPIENLFGQIRQHGCSNTNPTCSQFVAALKTVIVNNLSTPVSKTYNCEDDFCEALGNFGDFIKKFTRNEVAGEDDIDLSSNIITDDADDDDELDNFAEQNYATSNVAGYILKKLKLDCPECRANLFSEPSLNVHLFVSFKEYDEKQRLNYASERLIQFLDDIHSKLYKFLDQHGFCNNLENKFFESFSEECEKFSFCSVHKISRDILKINFKLTIYKYLRERNIKNKLISSGHSKKIKIFSSSRVP
ncbi:uncharacterized protein LOC123315702 isoform X2 [Coccinella septempunctata]|nr:uncharacterized protein LOC123315702 isoform X2 [Coccinella septempunctata]